jgi:aryl-alcohol dehydrogenase-like predicted oxidoreductase
MVTHRLGYAAEQAVIDEAARLGKGVLVKKGLASGHLAVTKDNFKHILGTPGVTSLLVGTLSPGHLAENAALVEQALG